jgi:hypothetical protein
MFFRTAKFSITLTACLAVLVAGLSADVIKLGHFPKGKWLDTTWQAYWTFGDDTIELRDVHDQVIYDFAGIVQRLKVEELNQGGIRLSFDCAKARRSYLFEKATASAPMAMSIRQYGSSIAYKTAMPAVSDSNLAEYKQAVIEAKTEDVARIVAVIEQAAAPAVAKAPAAAAEDAAAVQAKRLDAYLQAADKTDFSQLERLATQAESAGQADALIQDLEAKAAQPDAPPGVFIGLSVLYGRKNLKTQSYAALVLAEKAPPRPGVAINLALVYGRKQLLTGAPDAKDFLVGDLEVAPSEAGAMVSLDGELRGTGAQSFKKLPAGFHTVKVALAGFGDWETTLDLGVGQYRNIEVKLKALNNSTHPSTANVSFGWIKPEYTLKLDGKVYGLAELGEAQTIAGLAPGGHELAVEIPGYDSYRETLQLAAGQDLTVRKPLVVFGAPLAAELMKAQRETDAAHMWKAMWVAGALTCGGVAVLGGGGMALIGWREVGIIFAAGFGGAGLLCILPALITNDVESKLREKEYAIADKIDELALEEENL